MGILLNLILSEGSFWGFVKSSKISLFVVFFLMSLSALLQATTVFGIIPIVDFVSQTDREDLSAVSRVIFDFITSIGFSVSMISLGSLPRCSYS